MTRWLASKSAHERRDAIEGLTLILALVAVCVLCAIDAAFGLPR